MNRLAIIIPAYKATFLRSTLTSIANQTNLNFHLYIGDDNSPESLENIIYEFKNKIALTYVKFKENIGGKNLVSQWERCIALSQEEEWIWLFSDDDVMSPNCVEEFYNSLKIDTKLYLYHFNVSVINSSSIITKEIKPFPTELKSLDFLYGKLSAKYRSYVVEYIFSRKTYNASNGFPNFDLAWNTDDAMWFQLSNQSLIKTIPKANVSWRASGINISRIENNNKIAIRKLQADILYLKWLLHEIGDAPLKFHIRMIFWFFTRLTLEKELIGETPYKKLKKEYHVNLHSSEKTFIIRCYVKFKKTRFYNSSERIKKKFLP